MDLMSPGSRLSRYHVRVESSCPLSGTPMPSSAAGYQFQQPDLAGCQVQECPFFHTSFLFSVLSVHAGSGLQTAAGQAACVPMPTAAT